MQSPTSEMDKACFSYACLIKTCLISDHIRLWCALLAEVKLRASAKFNVHPCMLVTACSKNCIYPMWQTLCSSWFSREHKCESHWHCDQDGLGFSTFIFMPYIFAMLLLFCSQCEAPLSSSRKGSGANAYYYLHKSTLPYLAFRLGSAIRPLIPSQLKSVQRDLHQGRGIRRHQFWWYR